MLGGDVGSTSGRAEESSHRPHDDDVGSWALVVEKHRERIPDELERRGHVDIHDVVPELVVALVRGTHEVERACDVAELIDAAIGLPHVGEHSLTRFLVGHVADEGVERAGSVRTLVCDLVCEVVHGIGPIVEGDDPGALAEQLLDGRVSHAAGGPNDEGDLVLESHEYLLGMESSARVGGSLSPATAICSRRPSRERRFRRWSPACREGPSPRQRCRSRCSCPRNSRR